MYGKLWKSHYPKNCAKSRLLQVGSPYELGVKAVDGLAAARPCDEGLGDFGVWWLTPSCDLEFEAPRSAIKTKGREFFSILKMAFRIQEELSGFCMLIFTKEGLIPDTSGNKRFSLFTSSQHFQEQERQRESAWPLSWLHS